ncbi:MAG: type 4a pilus biogenesis protein PilO [Gammaproteobacteria bacterium]|nr:type 4a pilus biogenesis protein PilO [Gammaproteobacteria bacterium]
MLITLLVILSDILYFGPQRDRHQQLHNQVDGLRQQLLSLKLLNDPAKNLLSLTQNVQQINNKLNYHVDTFRLSKLILDLSKQHGLRIIRQTNSEDEGNGEWKALKQSLSIEGSYRQIRAFIDGIYQLPTMTIIQQASLQKKSDDKRQLTGSLLLLTYYNGMVR